MSSAFATSYPSITSFPSLCFRLFCSAACTCSTGCQWRNLPSDFPHWKTVYAYYQIW
ncbi:transposase, partial [Bacillus sp. SS-TM]